MIAEETLMPVVSTESAVPAKRIVYLFGAGATHAEADFHGSNINLLMNWHKLFGDPPRHCVDSADDSQGSEELPV